MMSKPIAHEATALYRGGRITAYGATIRSALAAMDSALFELNLDADDIAHSLRTHPIILGAAYCGRRRLQGLGAKDELRTREED